MAMLLVKSTRRIPINTEPGGMTMGQLIDEHIKGMLSNGDDVSSITLKLGNADKSEIMHPTNSKASGHRGK